MNACNSTHILLYIEAKEVTECLLRMTGYRELESGSYTSHRFGLTIDTIGDESDILSTLPLHDHHQSILILSSSSSWCILPSIPKEPLDYAHSITYDAELHFIYPNSPTPITEASEFIHRMLFYKHENTCNLYMDRRENKNILSIGTNVKVNSLHVEVYHVISAIVSYDYFNPNKSILQILVEGRMDPSDLGDDCGSTDSSMNGWQDSVTSDHLNDSQSDRSSPFPDQEYERVQPFYRNYYILRCNVQHGDVTASAVIGIQGIFKDQRPIRLLHLEEANYIIVSGTNGLLAMVDSNESDLIPFNKLFHLVEDSMLSSTKSVSHQYDSVITVTEFCYHTGCLASGDDQGTVCIWRLHLPPHRLRSRLKPAVLACPAFQLASRISLIRFSLSGSMLVVGVQGSLLLLGFNESNYENMNLYIHAVLDRSVISKLLLKMDL